MKQNDEIADQGLNGQKKTIKRPQTTELIKSFTSKSSSGLDQQLYCDEDGINGSGSESPSEKVYGNSIRQYLPTQSATSIQKNDGFGFSSTFKAANTYHHTNYRNVAGTSYNGYSMGASSFDPKNYSLLPRDEPILLPSTADKNWNKQSYLFSAKDQRQSTQMMMESENWNNQFSTMEPAQTMMMESKNWNTRLSAMKQHWQPIMESEENWNNRFSAMEQQRQPMMESENWDNQFSAKAQQRQPMMESENWDNRFSAMEQQRQPMMESENWDIIIDPYRPNQAGRPGVTIFCVV